MFLRVLLVGFSLFRLGIVRALYNKLGYLVNKMLLLESILGKLYT